MKKKISLAEKVNPKLVQFNSQLSLKKKNNKVQIRKNEIWMFF